MAADVFAVILVTMLDFVLLPNGFSYFDLGVETRFTLTLSPPSQAVFVMCSWVAALHLARTYESRNWLNPVFEYPALFRAALINLALIATFSLMFKVDFSRGMLVADLTFGLLALVVVRQIVQRSYRKSSRLKNSLMTNSKCLLVGPATLLEETSSRMRQSQVTDIDLAESFALTSANPTQLLAKLTGGEYRYAVLVGSDQLSPSEFRAVSQVVEQSPADLFVLSSTHDLGLGRIEPYELAGESGFFVTKPRFRGPQLLVKRLIDITAALVFFAILLIPLAIIALLIKREDGGPVFFRQQRVGRDGNLFTMLKFRSMQVGAEAQHLEVKAAKQNGLTNHVLFKDPEDSRITRVGKFIRRWSIDEAPQFYNVLIGEMSVVGPRPPLPSEVADYERDAMRRFKVKPGITGLWQVSGRASLNWEQSLRLDLYYVENWSPGLDIYLIFRTVKAVLTRDGAY